MSSLDNNSALFVAECLMEYSRKKERQEQLRLEQYLEHKAQIALVKKYMVLLSVAGIMMISLCSGMVTLAMQAREKEEHIADLKIAVSELKKENQEAEKRMHGNVDYRWVREQAEKLGMSQATKERIIYYSVDDVDYMMQYESIPQG